MAQIVTAVYVRRKRPDLRPLAARVAGGPLGALLEAGWAHEPAARPSAAQWLQLLGFAKAHTFAYSAAHSPMGGDKQRWRDVVSSRCQRDHGVLREFGMLEFGSPPPPPPPPG